MATQKEKQGFSGMQVFGIVAICVIMTGAAVVFITLSVFSPAPFTPVLLTADEQKKLERKIDRLEDSGTGRYNQPPSPSRHAEGDPLAPEPYTEKPSERTVTFTEREINSLLAHNTNLAQRVAVDLSQDLISIKMLVPVDPDFPVLGGKILKLKAGAELRFHERPVVILRGISVMGVPLPKAWLGGMKNVDLISEFGTEDGFWKTFADGVESLQVVEGAMRITLRE